jgi:hypothetical protein
MPPPLTVMALGGLAVMVNALAPSPKTTLRTCVAFVIEIAVVLELAKVAMSFGPFGTVAGVQFAAVFQSPLTGFALQVALPAKDWAAIKHEKRQRTGKSLFIL